MRIVFEFNLEHHRNASIKNCNSYSELQPVQWCAALLLQQTLFFKNEHCMKSNKVVLLDEARPIATTQQQCVCVCVFVIHLGWSDWFVPCDSKSFYTAARRARLFIWSQTYTFSHSCFKGNVMVGFGLDGNKICGGYVNFLNIVFQIKEK